MVYLRTVIDCNRELTLTFWVGVLRHGNDVKKRCPRMGAGQSVDDTDKIIVRDRPIRFPFIEGGFVNKYDGQMFAGSRWIDIRK